MDRLAVIDLGTNTFHLLIGSFNGQNIRILHKRREHVWLGRAGMEHLPEAAQRKAHNACLRFRIAIENWKVSNVIALGTAALRKARNASVLIRVLEDVLGTPIRVIDGATEALLIARGAALTLGPSPRTRLILDIGGGSVECILLQGGRIAWHRSFDTGVTILRSRFHHMEPIQETEVLDLQRFLAEQLSPLQQRMSQEEEIELIGSAGIFETLGRVLGKRNRSVLRSIPVELFRTFTKEVTKMDLVQRLNDPRIPRNRVEHVVTALLLIDWFVEQLPISCIQASPYALKEGAMAALAEGWFNPEIPAPPLWNNPSGPPPGVSG